MLNTDVFPNQIKISKVIPKYKSKDHTLLNNYRPIALIPSISKIVEYAFLKQLSNYFYSKASFIVTAIWIPCNALKKMC